MAKSGALEAEAQYVEAQIASRTRTQRREAPARKARGEADASAAEERAPEPEDEPLSARQMSYKKELPEGLAEWGCDEELWEQIQSKKGLLDLLRLGDEKRGRARIARLREMITEVAKQPPSGHADRGGQS